MSGFVFHDTGFDGLALVQRKPFTDTRGVFERLYCFNQLSQLVGNKTIQQTNMSVTRKPGVVRGLHFQYPPYSETKIISCIQGRVWDVAVDLREGSKTFLMHYAVELSDNAHNTLIIPEGFAHGFQALTADCKLVYFHTTDFQDQEQGTLNAMDPRLDIEWPLKVIGRSEKDLSPPPIPEGFSGLAQL
jgi:dTDP-4-dehydrorhamnose 3,5-epimerase